MATKRWTGSATATYDIWTINLTGTVVSQTYSVTINSKSITYAAGTSDTVATILAGLVANWTSTSIQPPTEFQELTPMVAGTTLVATANKAGNPCALSVSTTGSGTFTIAHTQTATGPNDFLNALNWSGGIAPANGDTLVFDNGKVNCSYNINTSLTGITLLVQPGYSGNIGLSPINNNAQTTYNEYRTTSLTLSGGTVNINAPNVSLCNLAFGANTTSIIVSSTGRRASQYIPPLLITGGNSSSVLSMTKGDVGVAFYQGQTAQFSSILTSYQTSAVADVTLYCGSGVTLATVTKNGGTATFNSNMTTFTQGIGGGAAYVLAGSITTAYCENGTLIWNSTGTLGTVTVSGNGTLDFTQDPNPKIVTNPILVYGGNASVLDSFKVVNGSTLSVTTFQTQAINILHGAGSVMTFM